MKFTHVLSSYQLSGYDYRSEIGRKNWIVGETEIHRLVAFDLDLCREVSINGFGYVIVTDEKVSL